MDQRLAGRIALVTGGGSGIGAAIARRFAAEGATVNVLDRNETAAQATVDKIASAGGAGQPRVVDVRESKQVQTTIAAIVADCGRLDIAVNAAGVSILTDTRIVDIPEDTWDTILAVNLRGPFLVCKYVLPHMVSARKGVIINISSQAGFGGGTAYASSKAGLNALSRGIARQHANDGVRCVTIAPGAVQTPMLEISKQKLGEGIVAPRPGVIKPVGTADEVAGLAAFLASDEAEYISGTIYAIDGGASGY